MLCYVTHSMPPPGCCTRPICLSLAAQPQYKRNSCW